MKGGECDSLNQVDPDLCIKCINQNRDLIVGVKVRLSASVANDGANEEQAFRFVYLLTVDFVNMRNCTLLEVLYNGLIYYIMVARVLSNFLKNEKCPQRG